MKTAADESRYHGQMAYEMTTGEAISQWLVRHDETRAIRTCTDKEATLHRDVFGHEGCDVVSGAVKIKGSAISSRVSGRQRLG